MSAESQPAPAGLPIAQSDRRANLEQRLFAFSPFDTWVTAGLVYAVLIGLYALAAVIDGAPWLHGAAQGYALDETARVALILSLSVCVALAMQRYARVREIAEGPTLLAGLSQASREAYLIIPGASLRWATVLGLIGGVMLIVFVGAPGAGLGRGVARSIWMAAVTLLLAAMFARGVEMTRVGSGVTRRAIDESLTVDLLHIDRLYGWGRLAARNSLTWFAVSASICLLFVSKVSPLVAALLLGACAVMGLWVFVSATERVHRRIHKAKSEELDQVRSEVTELRTRPGAEPETSVRLQSLLAYEARIAAVREWPFDQPILARVLGSALILAVPWFGQAVAGVLVEHLGKLMH